MFCPNFKVPLKRAKSLYKASLASVSARDRMAEMQEHQCMEEDNSMTSGGAKKRTSIMQTIRKFFRKPVRNRSSSNKTLFSLSRGRFSTSDGSYCALSDASRYYNGERSSDSDSDDFIYYDEDFPFSCKPGVLNNEKNPRKKYIMNVKMRYKDIEHVRAIFFARLWMTNGQFDEESRDVELIRSGGRNLEMMDSIGGEHFSAAYMEALFDPGEDGIIPRVVVLQGPAGIGKTWTVKKIMLFWADRNLYWKKFKYVFHLSCKEIHQIKSKISMATVLTRLCMMQSVEHFAEILGESKKILFLIDGFDELKFLPRIEAEHGNQDPFEETPKEILLDRLFSGRILPHCSLLITTRPHALNALRQCFTSPRYVEILGFKGEDRMDYFYNGYLDNETETSANFIKENKLTFTLCAVPFTCHVLETEILKYPQLIQTLTTTDIYIRYVTRLLMAHGRGSSLSSTCTKMCQLAKDGVWNHKFLFEEEDLDIYGLIVSEAESLFLNEIIFRRNNETRTCYSFILWSVQAFFASLYYVLNEESEFSREIEEPTRQEETMTLLERSQVNPHLTLTLRFLFGLYSEVNLNEVAECVGHDISTGHKSILEDWLMRESFNHHNEVLQCLYEAQDEDFVRRVMSHMSQILIQGLCPEGNQEPLLDIAVSYCLQKSQINHMVTFSNYTLSLETQSTLSPGLRKCSKLDFFSCRVLDISRICQSIRDVRELRFQCTDLTSTCCEDLCSVITNQSLITLDLSHNKLQDSGVEHLCEGLQDPGCVLQKLRLENCGVTSSCCEDLRSVITTITSLIKLDLSHNKLQDSGVKRLCEGLQHPGCVLQELRLQLCHLTSSCCKDLRSVITTNRSLIKLDLSHNDLHDSGVKRLCEGLRDPGCVLQELRLCRCGLTFSGLEDLLSVTNTCRSLTKLDMGQNDLQNRDVTGLQEDLTHRD
uniref:NACHT domain-containing protein n=1 Tax=Leptobrachium leishanense TaxID=445787 RepID=A0A8C5PMN9_9ANUR